LLGAADSLDCGSAADGGVVSLVFSALIVDCGVYCIVWALQTADS
jgi:hypothetical protein